MAFGEWSLVHDAKAFGPITLVQRDAFARLLAAAQLYVWEQCAGWFFWSYKLIADVPHWDFRRATDLGYFPSVYPIE